MAADRSFQRRAIVTASRVVVACCLMNFCLEGSHAFTATPTTPVFVAIKHSLRSTHRTVFTSDNINRRKSSLLHSSFYGDFENFDKNDDGDDDEEDDDDEDEYANVDDASVAAFRAKMGAMMGDDDSSSAISDGVKSPPRTPTEVEDVSSVDELIQFARSSSGEVAEEVTDWAKAAPKLVPGVILVANPEHFCPTEPRGFFSTPPNPSLLSKFGLTRPPPRDLGPDRQADLLPVVVLVDDDPTTGCRGVLLNRRTGYLLGDLEQPPPASADSSSTMPSMDEAPPILEKFCIQPLWFGGIDNVSSGLDMLHQCPAVKGAEEITEDGLYWGGDPAQAQEAMEDPTLDRVMSGFDFKFFVQSTIWSTTQDLDKEVKDGIWFPASVSKEVLFKSRDRMGTQKAKPLWTEIMELMGGEFEEAKNKFYKDDA